MSDDGVAKRGAKATDIEGEISLDDWELPVEGDPSPELLKRLMRDALREFVEEFVPESSRVSEEFWNIIKQYAADAITLALQDDASASFAADMKRVYFSIRAMDVLWFTDFIEMVRSEIDDRRYGDGVIDQEGLEETAGFDINFKEILFSIPLLAEGGDSVCLRADFLAIIADEIEVIDSDACGELKATLIAGVALIDEAIARHEERRK
jgi:hypothetical protein